MFKKRPLIRKRTAVVVGAVAILCAAALAVGLVFGLRSTNTESETEVYTKGAVTTKPESETEVYTKAAVTTNGYPCAAIGRDILYKNGSAVEAAIAALFCEGVVCLQSMGLGGGFLMTIYDRKNGTVWTVDARETAPQNATETMFHGNKTFSQKGGLAVAVPGELKGYWEVYNRYKSGNVEWGDLIQPTIDLCRNGITVTPYLAKYLKDYEDDIKRSPTLSEILIDKRTNSVWKEGDVYKRLKLAETLEVIKKENADALYNGSLTDAFIADLREIGSIITKEDLANYSVEWKSPITAKLEGDITLNTVPVPGSGVLLALILNILNGFIPADDEVINYQRITEAFKYGYGKRTRLGDANFVDTETVELVQQLTSKTYAEAIRKNITDTRTSQDPTYYGADVMMPDDHGTAHISVLAPNGDAVSVTSTVNLILGAKVRSQSTGIILNDEMDDFSAPNITNAFGIPPSPNNFIEPRKRPVSSMVPSIFIDGKGDVQLVTGAAGGTKITSSTALVAMNVLWFNKSITEAIEEPRFHHQLFPMKLQYEKGIPQNILDGLHKIGHELQELSSIGSSVTGIARKNGKIYAHSDSRRNGVTAGF